MKPRWWSLRRRGRLPAQQKTNTDDDAILDAEIRTGHSKPLGRPLLQTAAKERAGDKPESPGSGVGKDRRSGKQSVYLVSEGLQTGDGLWPPRKSAKSTKKCSTLRASCLRAASMRRQAAPLVSHSETEQNRTGASAGFRIIALASPPPGPLSGQRKSQPMNKPPTNRGLWWFCSSLRPQQRWLEFFYQTKLPGRPLDQICQPLCRWFT